MALIAQNHLQYIIEIAVQSNSDFLLLNLGPLSLNIVL